MADFLTPVSQTYRNAPQDGQSLNRPRPAEPAANPRPEFKGRSPEEALEVLKSQPSYDALVSVLKYLKKGANHTQAFNIRTPSPQSAQIIHMLVTEIVPNYWTVLRDSAHDPNGGGFELLLASLRSLTGVNAVLACMRVLIREARGDKTGLKKSHAVFSLSFVLELLSRLLETDQSIRGMWSSISSLHEPALLRPMRQEFLSMLSSGKVISVSAEAEDVCRQGDKLDGRVWTADGKLYVDWLGRNLVDWAGAGTGDEDIKLCAEITARAMRLGHPGVLVKAQFEGLLLRHERGRDIFKMFMGYFPSPEQRKVLLITLKLLTDSYLNSMDNDDTRAEDPMISASAGALKIMTETDQNQKNNLLAWLTSASGAGIGDGCGIRRAAVAVLAEEKEAICTLLEKSINQFGDQLYIRHAPTLQQEAHAQVLLLSAGYVHRIAPMKLTILLRSSSYLNAISNRIAASQIRARFLGMVVGEALSGLVHAKETKLDFKMDEMDTEEASWYRSLVHVSDRVGPLDPLVAPVSSSKPDQRPRQTKVTEEAPPRPVKVPQTTGFIIEEVEDDDDEDPDLVPYATPDSDPEDSDDDPTLITRDKPKAPVYIRDLIGYLRDTESYDKQKLGLATAPTLIRRKANYGTEVSSHAEELATLLVGLQDTYDLEDFNNLRLQAMVAVIVAQPKRMGPWFAKTFFDGDYSLSQRASVLIVLGLSGREIAGFETSEYAPAATFPSKTLPARVAKHYTQQPATLSSSSSVRRLDAANNLRALPPNAIGTLAQSLSRTLLAPLAAEAADAAAGPDALKLESFTSRLQRAQQQQQSSTSSSPGGGSGGGRARGVRVIPNTTASLLASSFFFPLTARFRAAASSASRGGTSGGGVLFQPQLLELYLQTLALLLHAAGPAGTLALPQMTSELWDLLLHGSGVVGGGGVVATQELGVTRAALLALTALLDAHGGEPHHMRALCERHGREVVASMEWAGAVFEATRGGDEGEGHGGAAAEENEVRMLAAAALLRLRDAVDKYQALLMGDLMGDA
ncbi:telomere length regulation protein-domain-containing protein [Xylariaceae sp. FL0804]|nr:telomere length regulation protein-domain-containing protein [Xylariaceae sp. FL0804]